MSGSQISRGKEGRRKMRGLGVRGALSRRRDTVQEKQVGGEDYRAPRGWRQGRAGAAGHAVLAARGGRREVEEDHDG